MSIAAVAVAVLAACGQDDASPPTAGQTAPPETPQRPDPPPSAAGSEPVDDTAASTAATEAGPCVVRLHGKGGDGWETSVTDGVAEVAPAGNDEAWGGRQWLYFPDDRFQEARAIVAAAVDEAGCGAIVLDGFSNGASFVAALYCAGETFGGRLRGVVIDDPVPDTAVEGCMPAPEVPAALYWTTALEEATGPGADCAAIDYTCAGGTTIGIDAYADALGVSVTPSPFTTHEWHWEAPEIAAWIA